MFHSHWPFLHKHIRFHGWQVEDGWQSLIINTIISWNLFLHLFRAMSVFVMGELCENTFARLKWPKPRTGEAENRYTACECKCWIMGKLWLWQFLQSFCSQELDMFAWAEVLPSIPNSRVVKWRQILDSRVFLISGSRLYEASRRGPSFKLDRPAILGMVLSSARHRPSERTWKKGPKFLDCFWTNASF